MQIPVRLDPPTGTPPEVAYRWDPDTEILSVQLSHVTGDDGMSDSLGLEGSDGSWVILDVAEGRINGVEVAVWPEVQKSDGFTGPAKVEDAVVVLPAETSELSISSIGSTTRLTAEADSAQRNFHFKVGSGRRARTIRLGRDLLLDVDDKSHISGLWLLNVPPSPMQT